MNRVAIYFSGPKTAEAREEAVPPLQPGQVLVRTSVSAISPGTEMLIFRGQMTAQEPVDLTIPALVGDFRFPLKYGYATVGDVVSAAPGVDQAWLGKRVFAFHPHESLFNADLNELVEIPETLSDRDAVFLANMETAVNFAMDGRPLLGEKVIVFGQGIVGLLATAILARFPLRDLVTVDLHPARRKLSERLGATASFDPNQPEFERQMKVRFEDSFSTGADLAYEISGNPEALNTAIRLTGFGGRVVIGSWYGSKPASLSLDTGFHRSRIRLISSQVSTVAPEFTGRWNKARRFNTAWHMLELIKPAQFITRSFPLRQASEAYRLLNEHPEAVLQIVFTNPDTRGENVQTDSQ